MQLGKNFYDVTAIELNNPDKFLEMAEVFSLDIQGRDALLNRHRQVSSITHNKNPASLEPGFDLDAAEQAVWDSISRFEPFLRQQVECRYKN